jgi:hypothetical protein
LRIGPNQASARRRRPSPTSTVLHQQADGSYEQLDAGLIQRITSVAPLDDGFMCMDRCGALQQYHPGYGYCTTQVVTTSHAMEFIPVTHGFAIIPLSDRHDALAIIYLTRLAQRPITACPKESGA